MPMMTWCMKCAKIWIAMLPYSVWTKTIRGFKNIVRMEALQQCMKTAMFPF